MRDDVCLLDQRISMIIITAEFDLADPASMPRALEVATPLQAATRADEPGCLAYVFGEDPCVPGRMQVFELWEDEATLAAHFKHENYFNMGASLGGIGLAGATATKFRVTAAEPVYDPDHKARANFFTQDVQAPEQNIIIAGWIDVDNPADRDQGIADSIPFQRATRDEEPGCDHYVFYADPCEPQRIYVYEFWENEAALAPHFDHQNYFNMGGHLRNLNITSSTMKYRCDLSEPVYDDTNTPRADFVTA